MTKVKFFIIIIGAVLACTAPFIHIFLPKKSAEMKHLEVQFELNKINEIEFQTAKTILKEKEKCFGFNNLRSFLYIIGQPLTMFFFSLIIFYVLPFIEKDDIRKALKIAGILLGSISSFFIIYSFWYIDDFPVIAYYAIIIFSACTISLISYSLIIHQNKVGLYLTNIRKLTRFIIIDVHNNYVSEKDKEQYDNEIIKLNDSIK